MSETPNLDTTAALRRLLGPAGAEITCEECFEQLDRYVELELAATTGPVNDVKSGPR